MTRRFRIVSMCVDAVVDKLCTDLAPCTISWECETSLVICEGACFNSGGAMHEDCGRQFVGGQGQHSECYLTGIGEVSGTKCQILYGCGVKGMGTCSPLPGYPGQFECSPDIITEGYCARFYCTDQVFTP